MKSVFGPCCLAMMLASIAGCASTAPEVTRSNNHVQMPHYSFVLPPDRGWHVQRLGSTNESAIIYVLVGETGTQGAALYLWFPEPERNESFIVALYSETIPPNSVLLKSYRPDFKSTLQTLTMR